MPRFPKKEADIAALAEQLWNGMLLNHPIFSNPPLHPILMRTRSLICCNRREIALAKQAAAETATTAKNEMLQNLVEAMKTDIRYAENTVDYDDDKLKLIGWAGRKARAPLAVPGQSRLLEAPKQGVGWVFLDWKKPADGGTPAAYKVMHLMPGRREDSLCLLAFFVCH